MNLRAVDLTIRTEPMAVPEQITTPSRGLNGRPVFGVPWRLSLTSPEVVRV
jgi:hypothetical protein